MVRLILIGSLIVIASGCSSFESDLKKPEFFPPHVPRTSLLISAASGRQVFHALDSGRVYVYCADEARVVGTSHVEPDQRFVIDPKQGRATVDGKPAFEGGLEKLHTHRIYFDPRDKAATTQPRPVP
jgi:hypothetical protein